jgi:UDP-N-acetylglucosamine 2-epimerase (hydrolysing)
VEALAGAIVGSLNNILVAHVEGGELSGTVDETLRHAISKMAHLHFVSNESALRRLCQMGERESSIFVIGSPDIDVMTSTSLPELGSVLRHYEVPFDEYAMAMFHPVTTEYKKCSEHARDFVTALEDSGRNYIVIYPNNDYGSEKILEQYDRLLDSPNFSVFPSIRFESFLTLLRHSKFMIGNSSAGIREAPFYGVPTVDIGSRQNKRGGGPTIVNVSNDRSDILEAIEGIDQLAVHQASQAVTEFGSGGSDEKFHQILLTKEFWETDIQKQFFELT